MDLFSLSLAFFPVGLSIAFWCRSRFSRSRSPPRPLPEPGLHLVYASPEDSVSEKPVDIIAIHGLDTNSSDTWTWKSPTGLEKPVNWLKQSNMLPSKVGRARIFTCDWPAGLFQQSVPNTLEESAHVLLHRLEQHLESNRQSRDERPILFIASCLGGIILLKTLEISRRDPGKGGYPSLIDTTRGIIFLATPFLGTAFKDMPYLTLRIWASLRDQSVTALITYTREKTPHMDELLREFIELQRNKSYDVFTFWEADKTSLLRKVHLAWAFSGHMLLAWPVFLFLVWICDSFSPWQLVIYVFWLFGLFPRYQGKQLVDESSASAQVFQRQRLDRSHVMMNKFQKPEDRDYKEVAKRIEVFLRKIREGTAIERADTWIRERHYTTDKLEIRRLSGETLSMEQCYINLAIVEQPNKHADSFNERPGEPSERKARIGSSQFSLFARLKVETPDEGIHVELPAMFNPRMGPNGHTKRPRRILIRGRAGVGKTTLCKKIIHEFKKGRMRPDLFDRLLWVPLRNLKERTGRRYDLTELFYDEYFPGIEDRKVLAEALEDVCNKPDGGRSLFVFDGLDEILHDLSPVSDMYRFVEHLLKQPNAIVTSRPSITPRADPFDLELETIGFYPHQVSEYIENAAPTNARDIQTFLASRPLIRELVRIPIQLDAVCYAWKDVYASAPETMTDLYRAIERGLGQKDVSRLEKNIGNRPAHENDALCPEEVERLTKEEIDFIAGLAFTGMFNNIITFDATCQARVFKHFGQRGMTIDNTLRRLSYLRPSDPSINEGDRTYYFLHLTLQEYFAARYFVERWNAEDTLKCLDLSKRNVINKEPAAFLRGHKYSARYDIFWRFVAGLLGAEVSDEGKKQSHFFNTIQREPLDLLGTAHQRHVMRCLSEVRHSDPFPLRETLEVHLSKWLVSQCKKLAEWPGFQGELALSREMEFPDQAIYDVLQNSDDEVRMMVLSSLWSRRIIPPKITELLASWLRREADVSDELVLSVLSLFSRMTEQIPEDAINAIATYIDSQSGPSFLTSAITALEHQSNLPEEILNQIVAKLDHQDRYAREDATRTLSRQSNLPKGILNQVVMHLDHRYHRHVRNGALKILKSQSNLSEEIMIRIGLYTRDRNSRLADGSPAGPPLAPSDALGDRPDLSEEIFPQLVAGLEDQDPDVRIATVDIILDRSDLPEAILDRMLAHLDDQDPRMRRSSKTVLSGQSNLTEHILNRLVTRLVYDSHSKNWDAFAAKILLSGRSDLQKRFLDQIVAQFNNQDNPVRHRALMILEDQSNLPEEVLSQIAARLNDTEKRVQYSAAKLLGDQSRLPEDIFHMIATRLGRRRSMNFYTDMLMSALLRHQEHLARCLAGGHVKGLFPHLLRHSFKQHIAWYLQDGRSCLETDNQHESVELPHGQSEFEMAIARKQMKAAIPAVAVSMLEVEGSV